MSLALAVDRRPTIDRVDRKLLRRDGRADIYRKSQQTMDQVQPIGEVHPSMSRRVKYLTNGRSVKIAAPHRGRFVDKTINRNLEIQFLRTLLSVVTVVGSSRHPNRLRRVNVAVLYNNK